MAASGPPPSDRALLAGQCRPRPSDQGDRLESDAVLEGSITAGKFADFVVLGQDPHKVEPDWLKDIRIMRTVVGGKTVFQRDGYPVPLW